MGYLTDIELQSLGFKKIGKNVLISDKCSIYSPSKIEIGDNVRIDDFCILSGGNGIILGNYIHIACYCSLIGRELIIMENFSGLSSRVAIYSSTDDYSGDYLTNPTVPAKYTNVKHGIVHLKKHVIVGAGTIILPGVTMDEGSAAAALTLVYKNVDPFNVVGGNPAKVVLKRSKKIIDLENELINNI